MFGNVLANSALPMPQFLVVATHSPYLQDLAPCGFFTSEREMMAKRCHL
jgi:hypothetical protein